MVGKNGRINGEERDFYEKKKIRLNYYFSLLYYFLILL